MSLEELIQRCAENGDEAAWEEFVQRFHKLIAAVTLRTARRWGNPVPATIDDLVQETYLKLCRDRRRLLSEFRAHHPDAFQGYLSVVTANVVHDHFRALHSQKRGSGELEESLDESEAQDDAPRAGSPQDMERNLLLGELDGLLCSGLSETERKRDRTIFWLYYRYGLTAPAISRLPSVSLTVKGVESVIHRLTRLLSERLLEGPGTRT
jgi:RNA polymerase sigma-70 factor (ECF subfamily)